MVVRNMQEARGLAERHLTELPMSPPTQLAILDEHTMETEFGWVFFWNSRHYQETGEFQYVLAGNPPLIVDRQDGSVHETSTAEPIEESSSVTEEVTPLYGESFGTPVPVQLTDHNHVSRLVPTRPR